MWSIGGAIVIYMWLWLITGKQRIILGNTTLAIVREMFGHKRKKVYDLAHISYLNASQQFGSTFETSAGLRFWGLGGGPIAFVYGSKTIRVGASIDVTEARRLCEAILSQKPLAWKAKRCLTIQRADALVALNSTLNEAQMALN